MAEEAAASLVNNALDNVVRGLVKDGRVTGNNGLEGESQENVQNIMEETVRNAVVTATNDVIRNSKKILAH